MSESIKQYAYTGDVKKLKSAGYTFQKLFADNYKTYHDGTDIFMYVVTQMVLEISNVQPAHQAAFVGFIIENADQPDSFWEQNRKIGKMEMTIATWHLTNHGRVVDGEESNKLFVSANSEFWDLGKTEGGYDDVPQDVIDACLERKRSLEGGTDPVRFHLPLVKKILALHALHPLELIESAWTH